MNADITLNLQVPVCAFMLTNMHLEFPSTFSSLLAVLQACCLCYYLLLSGRPWTLQQFGLQPNAAT